MNVTLISYAGDYREAFERLSAGGKETYQAQRYSVDFLGSLPFAVTHVCAICPEPYDVRLGNGVRAIGVGFKPGFDARDLWPFIPQTDRLILTTPMIPVLTWARRNGVRTMLAMADSFRNDTWRRKLKNRWIAQHLNRAEWVGNHQKPASLSLLSIGVEAAKVVPYDWPARRSTQKPRQLGKGQFSMLYAGTVCEAKGVADLIRALPHDCSLTAAGPVVDPMPERSNVTFLGQVPNDEISGLMRKADAVVVPSRHEYPEGLPLTILEALAARTPIIHSDHPMFPPVGVSFAAGDVESLSAAINRLRSDPALYARLSENAAAEWDALQIPVTYGELIERWLADDEEWLRQQSFADNAALSRKQAC